MLPSKRRHKDAHCTQQGLQGHRRRFLQRFPCRERDDKAHGAFCRKSEIRRRSALSANELVKRERRYRPYL